VLVLVLYFGCTGIVRWLYCDFPVTVLSQVTIRELVLKGGEGEAMRKLKKLQYSTVMCLHWNCTKNHTMIVLMTKL